MRTKGKIASWNDDRGFGFINPRAGGKQIFIHISALGNRNRRPELNEVVTYSLSKDKQGRPCAADATLAGDKLIKKAPKRGAWRTSESTLLVIGMAGGWPGALIAQETLRHKSKKASFQTVFWVTVLLNCAALAWLHTDTGREVANGLLA